MDTVKVRALIPTRREHPDQFLSGYPAGWHVKAPLEAPAHANGQKHAATGNSGFDSGIERDFMFQAEWSLVQQFQRACDRGAGPWTVGG